jgi:hypothetical protein
MARRTENRTAPSSRLHDGKRRVSILLVYGSTPDSVFSTLDSGSNFHGKHYIKHQKFKNVESKSILREKNEESEKSAFT